MKTITIYTDGACSGNPGPGGWGAILEWQGHQKELSGGEAQTTNNRMELTAVLTALAILKEPCIVELYSDSKYVVDAIEKGWLYGWQKKGWIKADKKPVLNVDLWQQLLPLLARHDVRLHWVKGHAENEKNNRCDQLAVAHCPCRTFSYSAKHTVLPVPVRLKSPEKISTYVSMRRFLQPILSRTCFGKTASHQKRADFAQSQDAPPQAYSMSGKATQRRIPRKIHLLWRVFSCVRRPNAGSFGKKPIRSQIVSNIHRKFITNSRFRKKYRVV